MKNRRFTPAGRFWKLVLEKFNGLAIVMPWRTCYVHPDYWGDEALMRHEHVHFDQIDREGPIVWTVKYLYWLLKYGYFSNPYEVEARAIARDGL